MCYEVPSRCCNFLKIFQYKKHINFYSSRVFKTKDISITSIILDIKILTNIQASFTLNSPLSGSVHRAVLTVLLYSINPVLFINNLLSKNHSDAPMFRWYIMNTFKCWKFIILLAFFVQWVILQKESKNGRYGFHCNYYQNKNLGFLLAHYALGSLTKLSTLNCHLILKTTIYFNLNCNKNVYVMFAVNDQFLRGTHFGASDWHQFEMINSF